MGHQGEPEDKKSLIVPQITIQNIEKTLQSLVNIQLEWTQHSKGDKLLEIDIPFVKGYLNVKVSLTGTSTTVAKPDETICIGHIVLKK